jgi:hypothetical protein
MDRRFETHKVRPKHAQHDSFTHGAIVGLMANNTCA